jgi:predicted secreted hydrolase
VNSESAWAANQFYMAHFALTDVANRRFYAYERFARAALDLAGAQSQPFRVWLEDWQATGNDNEMFPLRLKAAEQDVALDLNLQQGKNIVPQGDNGMSRKSSMPGNASYYYSLTRMPVSGAARIDDVTVPVNGSAWMDREWSTSALGREQAGWDWFALQLDDQREIMFYRLRNKDGMIDEHSGGSLVMQDGTKQTLNADDVVIDVREHWRSPKTSIRYPSGWRLTIPAQSLTLDIEPVIKNQELDLSVRYWEGAVSVTGDAGDKPVTGVGYVELAGYE